MDELPELVSISRDKFAISGIEKGQRTKTVVLYFKNEIGGIKRILTMGKTDGA
jgi:hypothetical protein